MSSWNWISHVLSGPMFLRLWLLLGTGWLTPPWLVDRWSRDVIDRFWLVPCASLISKRRLFYFFSVYCTISACWSKFREIWNFAVTQFQQTLHITTSPVSRLFQVPFRRVLYFPYILVSASSFPAWLLLSITLQGEVLLNFCNVVKLQCLCQLVTWWTAKPLLQSAPCLRFLSWFCNVFAHVF